MARVQMIGLSRVVHQILDTARKQPAFATVDVGFSAPYSAAVHEDLKRTYRNGQAKFLEDAIRKNQASMNTIVHILLTNGMTIDETLTDLGNFILAEAQALCPVDSGFLRASGYVRVL